MLLLSLAAAVALALPGGETDLPTSLAQDPAPPAATPQAPPEAEGGNDVFSFGRFQGSVRVGLTAFSEDFESDSQFLVGIAGRVDWPWLSRDVFGFTEDRLGLYADFTFSKIDRDLDFLEDKDGPIFFVGFGVDANLYEDESWIFRAQAGGQYGHFGGVDDTDNGLAGVLGIDLGFKLDEQMALQFNPQIAFGNAGDQIYFLSLGLQYRF